MSLLKIGQKSQISFFFASRSSVLMSLVPFHCFLFFSLLYLGGTIWCSESALLRAHHVHGHWSLCQSGLSPQVLPIFQCQGKNQFIIHPLKNQIKMNFVLDAYSADIAKNCHFRFFFLSAKVAWPSFFEYTYKRISNLNEYIQHS